MNCLARRSPRTSVEGQPSELIVEPNMEGVGTAEADLIVSRRWWHQVARPTRREIGPELRVRAILPYKIHFLVRAFDKGIALPVAAMKVLGGESLSARIALQELARHCGKRRTCERGALGISNSRFGETPAKSCQHSDGTGSSSVVVARERVHAISIWSDNGNALVSGTERKEIVFVLEQYECFTRSFQSQFAMWFSVVFRHGDARE